MKRNEARRQDMINMLSATERPISGHDFARHFNISRQIIVKDISILRSEGCEILSLHDGYVLKKTPYAQRVVKVKHDSLRTEEELTAIISLGGRVDDVFVDHRIYGRITAQLSIFTQDDVKSFVEGVKSGRSSELMNVTGGVHFHTLSAIDEETLDRVEDALRARGFVEE